MNHQTFGQGKTNIIFLHGWGADASAFLFVANRLSSRYRVTVLDFAGFGASAEPMYPYTVIDYAREVEELMLKLGIKCAVLVGHSFGGRVALELAANNPNAVKKLVLIDSAGLKPRRKPSYYVRVYTHKLLRKLGFGGLKGSSDYKNLSPLMKETFKNVVNYDQTRLLAKIKCPTAIFWGKADKETPPYMAKRLERGISDSQIFWLEGGHFSYADDFNTFFAIFDAFLREPDNNNHTETQTSTEAQKSLNTQISNEEQASTEVLKSSESLKRKEAQQSTDKQITTDEQTLKDAQRSTKFDGSAMQ